MECRPFEPEKYFAVNCITGIDGRHYPGAECLIQCNEGYYDVKDHLVRCEIVDGISMWVGKVPKCES